MEGPVSAGDQEGPGAAEAQSSRSLPLAGIKILDLSRLLPGAYCSVMLADFGAEVLKIEDTGGGDYLRWAPPFCGAEDNAALGTRSALYLALNRNKRSARIDLKSDAGREAFLRLWHDDTISILERGLAGLDARASNTESHRHER